MLDHNWATRGQKWGAGPEVLPKTCNINNDASSLLPNSSLGYG